MAMQERTKIYQLTYQMENVSGQVTINGFVITEMDGKVGNGTAALNPWLIGENELKAEVTKADPSNPAQFIFGVSVKERGDIMSTTDTGSLFSLELKNQDFGANRQGNSGQEIQIYLDFKPASE